MKGRKIQRAKEAKISIFDHPTQLTPPLQRTPANICIKLILLETRMGRLKMREWKNRHDFAGVENAGVETSGKIDTDAECYAGVCREKNG